MDSLSAIPSQTSNTCRTVTFASWNANALLPHIQQVAAMNFQVAALQEVRIPVESLASARKTIAKLGFNLVVGALPSYKTSGFNRKSTHVGQTVPGVGFLIAADVPYQELAIPAMQKWVDKGRFYAIKAFLNNRWVHCFSAYAPVMETEPFLDDVVEFLQEYTAECCLVGMDANSNTQNGAFVHSMHASGWCPLPCAPRTTSRLIAILMVLPLVSIPLLFPPSCKTMLRRSTHTASLRKVMNACLFKLHMTLSKNLLGKFIITLPSHLVTPHKIVGKMFFKTHKNKNSSTTVQEDWDVWCQAFAHIHTAENSPISGPPRFRTRDNHKNSRCLFRLCQAINEQTFQDKNPFWIKLRNLI